MPTWFHPHFVPFTFYVLCKFVTRGIISIKTCAFNSTLMNWMGYYINVDSII